MYLRPFWASWFVPYGVLSSFPPIKKVLHANEFKQDGWIGLIGLNRQGGDRWYQTDSSMDGWMVDGWINGWMDGWMNGKRGKRMNR